MDHFVSKGPSATYNCPNVRWNGGTSWPVEAGHGCIACASHDFWTNSSPFYEPLPDVPEVGSAVSAETVGLAVIGGVAGLSGIHAVGKGVQGVMARRAEAKVAPGEVPPPSESGPAPTGVDQ